MNITGKLYLLSNVLFFIFSYNCNLNSQHFDLNIHNVDSLQSSYPIFRLYDIDYKNRNSDFRQFYIKQIELPFFCKIEHLLEQNARIPIKIRLGDLNYVNSLENK